MPRKRYPNIKKGTDGLWHAWLTVGTKPNGRPDQRHIKRATKDRGRGPRRRAARAGPQTARSSRPAGRHDRRAVADHLPRHRAAPAAAATRARPGLPVEDHVHWVLPGDRRDPHGPAAARAASTRSTSACAAPAGPTRRSLKVHRILSRAFEVALPPRPGHPQRREADRRADVRSGPRSPRLTREDAQAVLAAAEPPAQRGPLVGRAGARAAPGRGARPALAVPGPGARRDARLVAAAPARVRARLRRHVRPSPGRELPAAGAAAAHRRGACWTCRGRPTPTGGPGWC
jgi:hypothetical protein